MYGNILLGQPFDLSIWEGHEIPCKNDQVEAVELRPDGGRIISRVHQPIISVYLPEDSQRNSTGVVICPGGGYSILAWDKEGTKIAEWFNSKGIAAFVLKYRLPHWESSFCRDKIALMDAQRAIRYVRNFSAKWNLDPNKIGIMGFSAGGHLAATTSNHFGVDDSGIKDDLMKWSARPDFSILVYPVISLEPGIGHNGSKENLIGKQPSQEQVDHFSLEKQVNADTPPTILIHASDDEAVIPKNSLLYYEALLAHNVPATLHIFEKGGHGFGLGKGRGAVENWIELVGVWMTDQGLMKD